MLLVDKIKPMGLGGWFRKVGPSMSIPLQALMRRRIYFKYRARKFA